MSSMAIVLAAGESRRLGHPKQLLQYRGKSLVQHAVDQARMAGCEQVVVVTGAFATDVGQALDPASCHVTHNEQWSSGLGSSISSGVKFVTRTWPTSAVLLMLCDQPLIPPTHLSSLLSQTFERKIVAATEYPDKSAGVPACFPPEHFAALLSLSGELGAKQILQREGVRRVPCVMASRDIDVTADLTHLE